MTIDPIRDYLRAISRYPLLDAEQELELGRQIQRWLHPPADASEVELEQIQQQGQRAKTRMINANLRLVVAIAKKYQRRGLEFLDLVQEGTLGLNGAAERYDPTKGYKFSTYAYWWVRQGITRAIATQSRTIRLPVHITERLNKIKKAQRQLSQRLGRTATLAEVAAEAEIEPQKIVDLFKSSMHCQSLTKPIGNYDDSELEEVLPATSPRPEELIEEAEERERIADLLAICSLREQQVIELRFGFRDGREWTLQQVADALSLSRERTRQIQASGLDKIRKQKRSLALLRLA